MHCRRRFDEALKLIPKPSQKESNAFLLMKQIQAIYREETTHKYMISDMELKRKAMEKVGSAGNSSYKYKPSADIMNFLNSLC